MDTDQKAQILVTVRGMPYGQNLRISKWTAEKLWPPVSVSLGLDDLLEAINCLLDAPPTGDRALRRVAEEPKTTLELMAAEFEDDRSVEVTFNQYCDAPYYEICRDVNCCPRCQGRGEYRARKPHLKKIMDWGAPIEPTELLFTDEIVVCKHPPAEIMPKHVADRRWWRV